MSSYGVKVSPPGSDVKSVTDLNARLTSKFGTIKWYLSGSAQFTTNGSGVGSVTIAHSMGYVPICMVFRKFTAQYTFLASTSYSNAFYPLTKGYNAYAPGNGTGFIYETDGTNLVISSIPGSSGVSPSTTYNFFYLIFVDPSQDFSGSENITTNKSHGLKVSYPGVDVKTGKEYEMYYSSKYKALQYYDNHIVSESLSLPEMWASRVDSNVQSATYVDFNHNLGYPPLFLAFSNLGTANLYEVPYAETFQSGPTIIGVEEVSAWCDSSRVRFVFRRQSIAASGEDYGQGFSSRTISARVIMFTENLLG
jgi:hypothetical protein